MQFRSFFKIVLMIALSLGVGTLSALIMRSNLTDWYPSLAKPPFTPPSWVFGPAWSILYCLMGLAAGIVWNKPIRRFAARGAVRLFIIQLTLNAAWSPLFFGFQEIGFALVEIVILWVTIAATTITFYILSKPAGVLMVPYLLWSSFAVYLNAGIWMLNK